MGENVSEDETDETGKCHSDVKRPVLLQKIGAFAVPAVRANDSRHSNEKKSRYGPEAI